MSSRSVSVWMAMTVAATVLGNLALGEDRIIKPVSATASPGLGSIAQTINGFGLSTDLVTGDAVPGTYPADTDINTWCWYLSNMGPGVPWMEFDLGADYRLSGFHLWNFNYNDTAGRSISNALVEARTASGSYAAVTVSPLPFAPGPGQTTYRGEDYTFASAVVARYVKLTVTANYGRSDAGISEIRFVASSDPAIDFIVKPTAVLASTEWSGLRTGLNTINGSGLSYDLLTGDPVPFAYPAHIMTNQNTETWLTDGAAPLPGTITYDLGAVYPLYGFHLWNYNGGDPSARSISNGVVSVSIDGPIGGGGYTTAALTASRFEIGGAAPYLGEDYVFAQRVRARYVRITANSNWGTGDAFVGMSEIRFITAHPTGSVIAVH